MTKRLAPWRTREIDYGLSTFGKSLPWATAEAFALFFLTDVARLPALMAGTYVLIFFLWNALCDPLVGWILDRAHHAGLQSRRYYVVGTLIFSALFTLSFTAVSGPFAAIILLATGLGFRTAYAAVDVPHNALLRHLGDTSRPRLGLSAARQVAGLTATFAVTFAARPLLQSSAPASPGAFLLYALGVAVTGAILFLAFFPKVERHAWPAAAATGDTTPATAPDSILTALVAIFLTAMAGSLVAGAFSKDVVYVAKYVFGDAGWTVDALMALLAGRLIAVPLWWLVPRRIGLGASIALAWLSLGSAGLLLSLLPPGKMLFSAGLLIIGIGLGGINALAWAIVPQLAHQFAHGRPWAADSRIFGLFTASTKVASGLSGLLLGALLMGAGLGEGPAADPDQVRRFYAMACFIPVPVAIGGLICLLGYLAGTGKLSLSLHRRTSRRSRPMPHQSPRHTDRAVKE